MHESTLDDGSQQLTNLCNTHPQAWDSTLDDGSQQLTNLCNTHPQAWDSTLDDGSQQLTNLCNTHPQACDSTLDDGSQQLTNFPSRTEQKLSSKNITAKMVSCAIYYLVASKTTGPDRIPASVLNMCSLKLFPVLAKLHNKCLAKSVFLPVGNLHQLCQFLKMERDLIKVSIVLKPSSYY